MNKEDYNKFYIQDSDHYLIPKNIFDELYNEMSNWREEAKELKKQLTTYQILHRDCKVDNLKNISKIEEMENQQKEFIKYMENIIKELECVDAEDEEIRGYLYQRAATFKEILTKYKEIFEEKEVSE